MRQDFKDEYRALIAAAFAADDDLARARARLDLLKDPDAAQAVAIQAQQALAGDHPAAEAHALGLLAVALSQQVSAPAGPDVSAAPSTTLPTLTETQPPSKATPSPTSSPPVPSASAAITPTLAATAATPSGLPAGTPLAAVTALPSLTPTPTSGAPFVLSGQAKLVCDATLKRPYIMVEAKDAAGQPVPGVEIIVTWSGGEDHFFTGLKPEHGPGYGDYVMTPDVTYTIHVADGGQPVPGLKTTACQGSAGSQFLGSWSLIFVQP
jgi:hypothetical protein